MQTIYFDYNATTPLDPQVREAMLPFLGEIYGNPSSIHHVGRQARAVLDESRERVAQVWGCKPSEVVFTAGGTESNNLAIFGVARLLEEMGKHLITSTVEHHSVLHCFEYLEKQHGFGVTYLPVDAYGRVDPDALKRALRPDTTLVSIMPANNETGTVQNVKVLGEMCRSRGIVFHTDAVQCFGKEPFSNIDQFNADLVSVCSHKFHGPKGGAALFVRSPLRPHPILFGGSHEDERRAGTENLAAIVGFAEASERFLKTPVFPAEKLRDLTDRLLAGLDELKAVRVQTPRDGRLSNTVAFTVEGADSISLLAGLDMEGICASSGSACSAGSLTPSHVLIAMGVERKLANSLVRMSLGRESTAGQVERVRERLPEIIERTRKF